MNRNTLDINKTDIENNENTIDHFEHESHLHKRYPSSNDHQEIISKNHNRTTIARLKSSISDDKNDTLHDQVKFSLKQFFQTFIYENLPPVIFSPIAAILIERSLTKA